MVTQTHEIEINILIIGSISLLHLPKPNELVLKGYYEAKLDGSVKEKKL